MSRAFDFAVWTVIVVVSVVIHLIGTELFLPGSPLYELATTDTAAMNGQEWADMVSEALIIWVPLIGSFGISAWVLIREYRRVVTSTVQQVPR